MKVDLDEVVIRWTVTHDLEDIVRIDSENSEILSWNQEKFTKELYQRDCVGLTAEYQNEILGFILYRLLDTTFSIQKLGVCRDVQRRGIGTKIICKLKSKLFIDNVSTRSNIVVFVHEKNLSMQLFYKKLGFLAKGVLHNYFENIEGDVYSMKYSADKKYSKSNRMKQFWNERYA